MFPTLLILGSKSHDLLLVGFLALISRVPKPVRGLL